MGHALEECDESGVAHQAALVDGCQDSYFIMEGLAKPSTMIQVQWG